MAVIIRLGFEGYSLLKKWCVAIDHRKWCPGYVNRSAEGKNVVYMIANQGRDQDRSVKFSVEFRECN